MTEITGRIALVTGGGSGIGRGLALALAAEGASVAVADILRDTADRVADEIRATGGTAVGLACDVSDRVSVQQLKEEATAALGPVSLLFANAGVTSFKRLTDMPQEEVDWLLEVDFKGVMNCIMAFYPDMVAARDGHVIATSSTAGLLPGWIPYHAPYSGAKQGVIGLMFNLRIEAAEYGVGATVICPGGVATGMQQNNARYRPERFGGPSDEPVHVPEGFISDTKLEFRPPEEIAEHVIWAVRNNRPMVLTDTTEGQVMRKIFQDTYVDPVMQAFDDYAAFEKALSSRR